MSAKASSEENAEMAADGRSVRVQGLPTEMDTDRLADKLLIHFLRPRNGGGEVEAITVTKTTPRSALVTFEDGRVAESVLRRCPQVLEVDGQRHELRLSLPSSPSGMDPDQVIVCMSVTVDCRQLPRGKEEAMTGLRRSFPGLLIRPAPPEEHCILAGLYSQVQAAVAYLLGLGGEAGRAGSLAATGQRAEDRGEARPPGQPPSLPALRQGSLPLDSASGGQPLEDPREGGGSADLSLPEEPATGMQEDSEEAEREEERDEEEREEEDPSLAMDADLFLYLRSRSEEYQRILSRHGVEVVPLTADGVSTLFLQAESKVTPGSGVGPGSKSREGRRGTQLRERERESVRRVRRAREELGGLYQQQQGGLRRESLEKSALCVRGGLGAVLQDLQALLPAVLLTHTHTHVCVVGPSSDVSQAKQMLLLGDLGAPRGDVTHSHTHSAHSHTLSHPSSHPPSPSLSPLSPPSSPSSAGQGDRLSHVPTEGEPWLGRMLRSSGAEQRGQGVREGGRGEGSREYRLAARFRSSGVGGLGELPSRADMLTLALNAPTPAPNAGRIPGSALANSGQPGMGTGALSITGPSRTGQDILFKRSEQDILFKRSEQDILFKRSEPLSRANSTHSLGLTPTVPPHSTSTSTLNTLSGVSREVMTFAPPLSVTQLGSGSTLRRASSFSGRSQPKQEVKVSRSGLGSELVSGSGSVSGSGVRPRSSSLSGVSMHAAEISIPMVIWSYMKEAYRSRLDDMTSDLQLSEESQSETSKGVRVVLRKADPAGVEACQRELQRLVAMVTSDFCVHELRLAEMGVTEGDQVLEACLSDLRSRFRKVTLHSVRGSLFMIGPKLLCSQVGGALREVFNGGAGQKNIADSAQPSQVALDQGHTHRSHASANGSLVRRNSQSVKITNCVDSSPRQNNSQSERSGGGRSQSAVRKEPVVKEKLGRGGTMEAKHGRTDTFLSQSAEANGGPAGLRDDGWSSPPITTQKNQQVAAMPAKQTNLQARALLSVCACVCGERGVQVVRTACGVTLCPRCLLVHAHCRVCPKKEEEGA